MTYTLRWTRRAINDYTKILEYLSLNWTERELRLFAKKAEQALSVISRNPLLFSISGKKKFIAVC